MEARCSTTTGMIGISDSTNKNTRRAMLPQTCFMFIASFSDHRSQANCHGAHHMFDVIPDLLRAKVQVQHAGDKLMVPTAKAEPSKVVF
ncbi:hypothetical protein EJB05_03072 [Eragrostis curvula]|uniref:Uncharacterized protein n=1 Tax=Eragrostis curvula TaxID=38414 RepID=A0A5J9WSA2_9POAL|nr:hypothetical protein EJB05_03072 [Eragrostis curvula]